MYQLMHAGPVGIRYENGSLRYLSLGHDEIVRMIYFALRDRYWQTAQVTITDEAIDQMDDSFRISYDWHTNDLGIQMTGHVTIVGEPNGTIAVDFYAKALNSFARNRIGLCVLHPLDGVAGQPCQVESPDGPIQAGLFPTYISPHQPFRNIRALRWQAAAGHRLQLDFSGDVFEMEDQRNWTDESFKTYSTPLDIPFPVTVQPGDEVRQRVVFSVLNQAVDLVSVPTKTAAIQQKAVSIKPRIGVGQRADGQPLQESEATLLRKLNLTHLRADVFLTRFDWQSRFTRAVADARALHVPLELGLFFGEQPQFELTELMTFASETQAEIGSVLLFDAATLITSDVLLQQLVHQLRSDWPRVPIGGGTDGAFADFNRNRFDYEQVDFVVYSVNPQVHAFDNLTLLENIEGQRATVETARYLTGGKPIHISPITLLPRYLTTEGSATERLTPPTDPRHATDFGAHWTNQSRQALTDAGVASLTYYESHGPRGLVDGEVIFPVYETLM